ncbi:MAG TPA: hypothetical protein VGU22_01040 [Methylomirabilota bacterium]|nr:hypothetical protein [Methylomirabilota bacterium]
MLLACAATIAVRRVLRRPPSRASLLLSVVAAWLAAYVLWGFAGGLAERYGFLDVYDGKIFGVVAVAGGFWQYRTQLRDGRERGLAVFVAVQLLWLLVVIVRNQ